MKKLVLAVCICGLSSPAIAQDGSPFNGFYIGAVGGHDDITLASGGEEASENGVAFGGVAGYDYTVGSLVFGAEIELGESTTSYSERDVLVDGDTVSLDAGLDFYVGARAGVAAGDAALIYVKGGFASSSLELSYDDGAGFIGREGDNMGGWRVGAGVELALSKGLRIRGEYRYSDFGEFRYNDGFDVFETGIDATRSQFVGGVLLAF